MRIKLQIINGPEDGSEFFLKKKLNYLGRSPENEVIINLDNQISRKHAKITVDNNEIWLEDLDSRNGTFINNERLRQPYLLSREEVFRLGKTSLQLIIE